MVYLGPLLLGIIIGASAASGFFLRQPGAIANQSEFIGAAVTVDIEPLATPVPQTQKSPDSKTPRLAATNGPAEKIQALMTNAAQQGTDSPTVDDPSDQPKPLAQKVFATETATTPEPSPTRSIGAAPEEESSDANSDNETGAEVVFPGLSLGGSPAAVARPRGALPVAPLPRRPLPNVRTARAKPPEQPTPQLIKEPQLATPPVPTAEKPEASEDSEAEPQSGTATQGVSLQPKQDAPPANQPIAEPSEPPIIRQADLVLPRRHPRLQKARNR